MTGISRPVGAMRPLKADPRRGLTRLRLAVRLVIAVGALVGTYLACSTRWRIAEARLVAVSLPVFGIGDAQRIGDQILVVTGRRTMFSVEISAWCSSLAPVLIFAVYAVTIAAGDPRQRWRATYRAVLVIVVGNHVRMTATLLVGAVYGPGSIEVFHDGPATYFAVGYTLLALLVFVSSLPHPVTRRAGRRPRVPHDTRSSHDLEML